MIFIEEVKGILRGNDFELRLPNSYRQSFALDHNYFRNNATDFVH